MSRVRECFACGTLLAQTERQRIEVRRKREKVRVAEVCQACWWQIRGKRLHLVSKEGRTYQVGERSSQLELMERTARTCIGGGGRHG